jgi:KaiC/GvpD/RAD55 family RecA-like ATPase
MKHKTLKVCTLDALIDKVNKEPAIKFVYPGIAPGSIGIVFGPSKSGKTTFCENLAMSIASGANSFLGKPINCTGRKVLFISLEEFYQGRTARNTKQVYVFKLKWTFP